MPTIDPRIGTWTNFVALILAGIGAGAVQWGGLSADTVTLLKTIASDGLFILTTANLVFHLYSAPVAGPLAK